MPPPIYYRKIIIDLDNKSTLLYSQPILLISYFEPNSVPLILNFDKFSKLYPFINSFLFKVRKIV